MYNSQTKKGKESNLAFISIIRKQIRSFPDAEKLSTKDQLAAFPLVLLQAFQFFF